MFNPFEALQNDIAELKQMMQQIIDAQSKNSAPAIEAKLKSQKEVLKEFGVSLPTLLSWRKKGLIKAVRISNRIYYRPEHIQDALIEK